MSALWGEMKVTACIPHAGKQSTNSAMSQDVKPCCALAVDWCLLRVWATKICHFDSSHQYTTRAPGAQCKTQSNWMPRRYAGRGVERRNKQTHGGHHLNWWSAENKKIITECSWSNSAPLSRQNRLRLISDAWIQISKGWKTNMNSNLKFEVRKSELRLTTLV